MASFFYREKCTALLAVVDSHRIVFAKKYGFKAYSMPLSCHPHHHNTNIPPYHLQTRDDGVGSSDGGDDISRRALRLVQALHWNLTKHTNNQKHAKTQEHRAFEFPPCFVSMHVPMLVLDAPMARYHTQLPTMTFAEFFDPTSVLCCCQFFTVAKKNPIHVHVNKRHMDEFMPCCSEVKTAFYMNTCIHVWVGTTV